METFASFIFPIFGDHFRSYPTYEEWKPRIGTSPSSIIFGSSYPTYEEWKHDVVQGIDTRRYSSYPTYEEWKLTYRAKVYH